MIIAIHQPNYMPWLGYFAKIACADTFVFLQSAQFSKGGYTNRVRIALNGVPRWLTVPVSFAFGDPVGKVGIADRAWADAHRSTLRTAYGPAARFREVWPSVESLYDDLPEGGLAAINICLVERMSVRLGLDTRFVRDEDIALEVPDAGGDDRLIALCRAVGPGGVYLSGAGGDNYQDTAKFSKAGLGLEYSRFPPEPYPQVSPGFLPGLSILDAVFNIGWDGAAEHVGRRG